MIEIDYYSDVLCIWAWIAQKRNDELVRHYPGQLTFKQHYLDLFADVPSRIGQGWQEKGGYEGFAQHVQDAAAPYELSIHPDCWRTVQPSTSANAHISLKAIEQLYDASQSEQFAVILRKSFFEQAQDIGNMTVIDQLISDSGLDAQAVKQQRLSGLAIAALMGDIKTAQQNAISGSPTWLINQGRQKLYGNVGYRILSANIDELLKQPKHEASWC